MAVGTSDITSEILTSVGAKSLDTATSLELLITCTASSTDATIPDLATALTAKYAGLWITKIITKPGATQPTAFYDITGIGVDDDDVFDSQLLNRSATLSERVIPLDPIQIGANGFKLVVAGNAVNSAIITIRIFLNR
jgi:hypothetical protein